MDALEVSAEMKAIARISTRAASTGSSDNAAALYLGKPFLGEN
jgi:hypothetical protein